MKPNILFKTNNQNNYLYNANVNHFFLIHPVMNHLLELQNQKKDIKTWLDQLDEDQIQLDNLGTFSKEEIQYYYKKFLLFQENQFLQDHQKEEKLSGRVTDEQVKSILSNVSQVVFETTDSCNLKCKYCGYGDYYEGYDKRENKFLDVAFGKSLIDYLITGWNSPLNTSKQKETTISFYGGEPFLNMPFIKEMIEYLEKLDTPRNHFSYRATTNGLLIEKYMDFLVENDFKLLVSLDGDEDSNGFRVLHDNNGSHSIVYNNLKSLEQKYPEYYKKNINFNVVLHKKNSIKKAFHYFKDHFNKIPTLSGLNTVGIRKDKKEDFIKIFSRKKENLDSPELEKDFFTKLPNIKTLSTIIHQLSGYCYKNYSQLLYSTTHNKRIPTGTCLPFSKKIFLTVNGKILPCERIDFKYTLGKVDQQGTHINPKEVAEQSNQYFDKIRKKCSHCYNAETCDQCIFNLDLEPDTIHRCPGYLDNAQFSEYLSEHISKIEKNPKYYYKIMEELMVS